jgi:uncharacterized protein YacL
MDRTINIFRFFFLTACGVGGYYVADAFPGWADRPPDRPDWPHWVGFCLGTISGLIIILADRLLKGVSLRAFSSATFGLALGGILAWLLLASRIFEYTGEEIRWLIHLTVYLVCGYLGMMLALRSNKDEFSLIIPYVRFQHSDSRETTWIVDTSAIIDGRIVDLVKSGFIEGTLSVPAYVLEEVKRLADSSDPTRRAKGRRGQETLDALKASALINFRIPEGGIENGEVDAKLIHTARLLGARIITTDYNLQKIAEIQGVKLLNVHELSKATRPLALPGEVIEVKLVKEGKDSGQGVGYLSDGTMIVVNMGKPHLGQVVQAEVASILQTPAGRMVFADLKHAKN